MLVLLSFTKDMLIWFQGLEINNSLTARGNKSSPVNNILVKIKLFLTIKMFPNHLMISL